jgi:hypothetical protein
MVEGPLETQLSAVAARVHEYSEAAAEKLRSLSTAIADPSVATAWTGLNVFQAINPEHLGE